jgi:hypothetical protein
VAPVGVVAYHIAPVSVVCGYADSGTSRNIHRKRQRPCKGRGAITRVLVTILWVHTIMSLTAVLENIVSSYVLNHI